MTSRNKSSGLKGLVLGGALSLSSCVSQADKLYNEGLIDNRQYQTMKAQERRQEDGVLLSLLGGLVGVRGAQVGNVEAVVGGQALGNLGSSIAGSGNTTVYVGNQESPVRTKNIFQQAEEEARRRERESQVSYEVFVCSELKDSDHDGFIDQRDGREAVDRGKIIFYVGEPFRYVVSLQNCQGRTLKLFGQTALNEKLKEIKSIIIQTNNEFCVYRGILDRPATWYSYWTLDDVRIGENLIQVRER